MSVTLEQPPLTRPPALRDVPPFPPVAARLMRLVSEAEEDFSYKDVANLIRADAGLSIEVLRLANSPVFGFRYEIKDIPHAIAVLGLNRLRAIVTTLAMKDFVKAGQQHESVRQSWRHNLATALACEVLAGALWVDSGLGYTSGLLHDVGLLAMAATHSDEYWSLINTAQMPLDEFMERERQLMGIDHCAAGDWLLTEWNLPEEFRAVAAEHHTTPNGQTPEIVELSFLGCTTASMAGFSICTAQAFWKPEVILEQLPERTRERFLPKLEELPLTIGTKINSFDCDFLN